MQKFAKYSMEVTTLQSKREQRWNVNGSVQRNICRKLLRNFHSNKAIRTTIISVDSHLMNDH